uniref:Uncharacterized protein n=1 Tax=Podoviridae sp. ct8Lf7 TaxID=2827723 RepID=A0A8S5S0E8_9CAUD|nr:MAG TPA: hypothetical protein [Podoviridae sp. ct8Lf7]
MKTIDTTGGSGSDDLRLKIKFEPYQDFYPLF